MKTRKGKAIDILPLFTNKTPALSLRDISESGLCSYRMGSRYAEALVDKGFLKKLKVRGNVFFSMPEFDGDIEELIVKKNDKELSIKGFEWPVNIVKERKHFMELATQFYKILGNNNMELFA